MVVVQLLTTDPEPPRRQVRGGIGRFVVAVAPPVAQAIDHARGPERDPRHLDRPQGHAGQAEQHGIDREQQYRPQRGVRGIQVALDHIIRGAAPVLLDVRAHAACFPVQLHAMPEHRADAAGDRAVRVVLGLHLGVVLAVDGHPLAGDHRGGQPQPETEHVGQRRVEIDAAMGLAAVQVQGHREDGDLGEDQQHAQHGPPAEAEHTTGQQGHQGIGHGGSPYRRGDGRHHGRLRCKLHPCGGDCHRHPWHRSQLGT